MLYCSDLRSCHAVLQWLSICELHRSPALLDAAFLPLDICVCSGRLQVQSLSTEHSPDIMLLAARAITHLADVMPAACSSIVRHGAVAVLCGRLLAIEYIDLAEQSLQALEKLSHEHPAVSRSRGSSGLPLSPTSAGSAREVL